ncbi:tyrosine-type recombinase/integrase [Pseudotabrizicola algicola]|uniref:Tyrosine-type recombinase/integrase n=1 Tax=Pseudotabrizicola algicola TaxID=2709381 RepID=A0A6B3RQ85_9RHOB|nr:tyrosine-type recombinase/integrase [Pseudotabrizicola algicola]NEX45222.1 tyrosine-type recombinase/integrase [Pseudotabrizicola algicola]
MKGLWVQPRDGRAFYRTRKGGKTKLVPLPDLPHDHPDFIAAWAEAARDGKPAEKPKQGTLASTWNAMQGSPMFASWTPVYRAKIARQFTAICETKGHVSARAIRDPHITKDVSEAPSPGDRLRAWRAWGAWCKERGLIADDPARTVRMPRTAKAKGVVGHRRWTADDIERFRARWPVGTTPRAVMELLLWTGARISDAVRIGPQMVDRQGVLVIQQGKTGERAYVPWTCALPPFAAEADRQTMLAAIAPYAGHLCFVPARDGRIRSVKSATQMMLKACAEAKVTATSHGLRKTRSALIIESGGSATDSAAWTGHISRKMAEHYQREYDRHAAVMGIPNSDGNSPDVISANRPT